MKAQKELRVRLTFTENVLGTSSANPDIHKEFIASKAPTPEQTEEEVAAIDPETAFEKALTVFPRTDDGKPFLWDYQIKGFFKDTCGGLRKVSGSESSKVKAYKKEIDKLIFVHPRKIPFEYDGEITICQRPLRGSTPQGERIALASSEQIPAGATIEFTIDLLTKDDEKAVIEWLDYGELSGIGQWRNSGEGRFLYELLDEEGNVIGGNAPLTEEDIKELFGGKGA